ncbi:hypothetical protein ACWC6I_10010 [Streptomyces sp. NPDC001414]
MSESDALGYDFLARQSVWRAFPRRTTVHEGDERPVQLGFGALQEMLVAQAVAPGGEPATHS